MAKALEVEQKQGPKKLYWRVRTDQGWANSFNPVAVGDEGELVTKGQFTNFVPSAQNMETPQATNQAIAHNEQADQFKEMLRLVREIHKEVVSVEREPDEPDLDALGAPF